MSNNAPHTPDASRHHCRSLVPKLAAENPMDPSHVLYRRECFRWPLPASAAIRYHANDGTQVVAEAAVEDLGANGIGLSYQADLPADLPAEVFVSVEGRMYSAAVRVTHSTPIPKGFRIGCEFVVREEAE
jgi:hypothetical protein